MKFLIWLLCILVNSVIITIVKEFGITLGAMPSTILFAVAAGCARTLCKKWDEHKEKKAATKKIQTQSTPQPVSIKSDTAQPTVQASDNTKICFCRKCGSKLIDDAVFCNQCGTKIIKG